MPHSNEGTFTNATGGAPSEDQLVAFVYHNGPTQTGIYSDVFALREKGCEATGTCWITAEMCASVKGKGIDHSITLAGYGTDPVHGDFWLGKGAGAARAHVRSQSERYVPVPRTTFPSFFLLLFFLSPSFSVKNSWGTAFANDGFIFVQRGVNCGQIACCGNLFTIGDPAAYYEA